MAGKAKIFCVSVLIRCIIMASTVEAFNVDNTSTVKRITRPRDSSEMDIESNNSYHFGYNFVLDGYSPDKGARLIIGSSNVPVRRRHTSTVNKPEGQGHRSGGGMFNCPIDSLVAHSNKSCVPMRTSNEPKNKLFGNTIMVDGSGGVMTCSPTQELDCGIVNYKPGFCYLTMDAGETWYPTLTSKTQSCPVENVDVMFVIDGSGSIGENNFNTIKDWVISITKKFDIDGGKVRVGVVQYSHWFKSRSADNQEHMEIEVGLGQHSDSKAFARAVRKITLQGFTTYTAHALNVTTKQFMQSDRFNDSLTKKVIILLTDGASHDYQNLPYTAKYVRSLGIVTYAIGVGEAVTYELRIIATGDVTSPKFVYEVGSFDGLQRIVSELQTQILKNVLEGSGEKSSVTYDMQMAETGFSSHGNTRTRMMAMI